MGKNKKAEETKRINSVEAKGMTGKISRSFVTGSFLKDSVKAGFKVRQHAAKGSANVRTSGEKITPAVEPANLISPAEALMAPIIKKPESQMTSIEKMEATRRGISKNALEELKNKAGFDYDQLAEVLGVARTTLINKRGAEKFPLGLSERIMSLADLYSFGYEVFGDRYEFNQWILEPLSALGGQAPYALLNNQYGREEVKNLIGRIAYGTYS